MDDFILSSSGRLCLTMTFSPSPFSKYCISAIIAGISLVEDTLDEAECSSNSTSAPGHMPGLVEGITVAYDRPAPVAAETDEIDTDNTSLDDLMAQMKAL